jgi:S-formylglutathione hydrolase
MEQVSAQKSFGGIQGVYTHASVSTKTDMTFSVFVPEHAPGKKLPILWYLSGLTCTHSNVTEKGGFRKACAGHRIIFIAPDTSPRGPSVPDDKDGAYDFGLGAGFYVDATEEPFAKHYHMRSYIENELPELIAQHFPTDMTRQGITGHSMGGHGALTIALRNPKRFKSVSAFAPISSRLNCPWGDKALSGYLGANRLAWREYDACALIEDGAKLPDILVDQGTADNFMEPQLKPELLRNVCDENDQPLTLRLHEGYDHSYSFISSFMTSHLVWNSRFLN